MHGTSYAEPLYNQSHTVKKALIDAVTFQQGQKPRLHKHKKLINFLY